MEMDSIVPATLFFNELVVFLEWLKNVNQASIAVCDVESPLPVISADIQYDGIPV
jgi:hypothetical protein